jgi:hypothetical protein
MAGWVIIDTGFPEDHVRETWSLILDRLDGPVHKLIVTHFHPDLGLATWLMEKTGAPLWMSTGEFLTAHVVWNEVGGHGARFMVEQFRQHGLDAGIWPSSRSAVPAARRPGAARLLQPPDGR